MFTTDNTEGFTIAQLAAMNDEYQSDMQSVLAGFHEGASDELIDQIQQSVSEAVLKRHGGA